MTSLDEETKVPEAQPTQDDFLTGRRYARAFPGILKIVEVVISVIVLICAAAVPWWGTGADWVIFVAVEALICTTIFFILHCGGIIARLPRWRWDLFEFLKYCIDCVLYAVVAIISAVKAGSDAGGAAGAAAFFCFSALLVYGVDAYYLYRTWREAHDKRRRDGTENTTHWILCF